MIERETREYFYKCECCHHINNHTRHFIESMERNMMLAEKQVDLWKGVCRALLEKTWWEKLFIRFLEPNTTEAMNNPRERDEVK